MDKEIIKKSLFSLFVPEKMNPTSFKKWLNTSNAKKDLDSSKKITSLKKARSISELHILVKQHTSFTLTQNSIHKIAEVLNTIKPTTSIKDYLLWAETICLISKNLSPDEILSIVPQSSTVRNIIWPIHTKLENSIGIEIWCQLKVSILPAWAKITEIVNDNDYLTGLCFYLPWRDWKAITSRLNIKDLERAFITSPPLSNPEALLWIWKNRQMLSDTTTKWLNHTKFFFAITGGLDTAIWQVAKKELKKMIQENTSFQNHILKKGNESNIIEFLEKLNNTDSFTATEKQSLIVKLSREYPILKKLFETGKVKKIMLSSSKDKANRTKEEIYITSFKSFNEKIKELNDIINVQIPENTKAIATARAHGDLRENAEYAAAKERQKYINEHRAMLEMRIAITRPTDFSDITISDKIIVGTTVHLKYDNNKLDVYHILGAWDSVPEKKYISYETEFGKVLIGKKVGDIVTHPDGITCIVEKILPLSEKIRKTLSKTHLEM
jgi:transcription elongation GreA/GreB family factor